MIGGRDIRIGVPSGAAALDFAVRAIRIRWPGAVFAANGDVSKRYDDLEFHDSSEIIAYKDRAACQKWRAIGYDESVKGTMIYLISDRSDLTIVVEDEPSAEIQSLVSAIEDGLVRTFHLFKPAA